MLKALNKLFGGRSGVIETAPSARVLPLKDVEDEEIPRYPPFAKGLPVAPLDKILATQAELIEKVRNSLGFTVDDFNRLVLPVIQRYAAFVHLLPASESHHHRGAGGLFRHGLEVAFWAAQASESVIFSIEGTPRERRDNEPRWRLASCFSGLLHDVGKPLSDVSITDKDGSITWNPYSESLHDWAHRHEIDRYFIRWRDKRHKRHEQFSLLAVDRIIPAETREFLSKSGPSIMEAMLEAISGTSVNQPVTKLMLRADQESVSRDLRQSRLDVDEFSYKHSRMLGVDWGTSTSRLTHSTHRQRQPALTQQTQKSQMWQCPESKRSSQNRTSFHKNKTPCRAMTFQCSVVLMNRHHGRLSRSLC
ncbi:TPA: MobH family relaxase [Citrobacter farmeri]